MKRQIKKIAQLIIVFCFTVVTFAACGDADEEIFDNIPIEESTDEEDRITADPYCTCQRIFLGMCFRDITDRSHHTDVGKRH